MSKLIKFGKSGEFIYSMRTSDEHDFDSHIHQCYEFLYVNEGTLIYTIEGKEYIAHPGDVIFTRPMALHSLSFPVKCQYTRQFFHIYDSLLKKAEPLLKNIDELNSDKNNLIPAHLVQKYRIGEIFDGIRNAAEMGHDANTADLMLCYAVEIMLKISSILQNEKMESTAATKNENVLKIMNFIEQHYRENIRLEDIANLLYLDKSYVGRIFRRHTGMSIKPYINMRRITLAKKLISTGRQATEVYLECGFENYCTFYRVFKKLVGVTPEEFKRMSGV